MMLVAGARGKENIGVKMAQHDSSTNGLLDECHQVDESDENVIQMMMMTSKYLRSKSLPVVYSQQFHETPSSKASSPPAEARDIESPIGISLSPEIAKHSSPTDLYACRSQPSLTSPMKDSKQLKEPEGGNEQSSKRRSEWRTLQQHYYPEGGWGWVILFCAYVSHAISFGVQIYISHFVFKLFGKGWLGAISLGVSLLLSPVWVSICRRKSTRLAAVFGGLIASLGCLFTSFASQFHQLVVSYGIIMGIGVGLTRDASTLMVGQYFKRKRDFVEIFLVSSSGCGILVLSFSVSSVISSLGWRLGLQAVTGCLVITFFLGTCHRSASLYHPQRRAILHLKNQKRKIKENKEKRDDKATFIDFTCLRSKTVQILLLSTCFTSFGIFTPFFSLPFLCKTHGLQEMDLVMLHVYIGLSWIIGTTMMGLLVFQKNQDCRISKQYLCQMCSMFCGISIVALGSVNGYQGLVAFSFIFGFFFGGYFYSLKVYTYERVRARHFPRAWSFLQSSQAVPLLMGVPLSDYLNKVGRGKYGYYLSALCVLIGLTCLFITDVRKRRLSRRKSQASSTKTVETTDGSTSPNTVNTNLTKRSSLSSPVEQMSPLSRHESGEEDEQLQIAIADDNSDFKKELSCLSEEVNADMDFQDLYYEDWAEYFGECITSCNKVENCLASEYDGEYAVLAIDRKSRRWSALKPTNISCPLNHAVVKVEGLNELSSDNRGRGREGGRNVSHSIARWPEDVGSAVRMIQSSSSSHQKFPPIDEC